jgi:hypothetical protein
MEEKHYEYPMLFYVGCDFAVSKEDHANRTSFTVGGLTIEPMLQIVAQHVGRWDTSQWIEVMFRLNAKFHPDMFFLEGGVIWKAIEPMLNREMRERGVFLPIQVMNPVKDKKVRGRAFQKRHKAQGMRFDKQMLRYEEYEAELMRFTGNSEALLDDQFDSTATLCMGLENLTKPEEADFEDDETIEFNYMAEALKGDGGRSLVTGY